MSDLSGLTFYKYHSESKDDNTLNNNTVFKLYQDDQSLIWAGTAGGISIYNRQNHQFECFDIRLNEELEHFDNNIHISNSGELFIGSLSKGVIHYNYEDHSYSTIIKTNEVVRHLYSPDDRHFFLGSKTNIIHYLSLIHI